MKVKLYIVTYQNFKRVADNISSLQHSNFFTNEHNEVIIINNSPLTDLQSLATSRIRVIPNHLRPESSIAHLTRSWNQCLVNGFLNLERPDCDIVITSQDDVVFDKDWYDTLIAEHQSNDFITFGPGDMICSYTVNAVKKAGIWDENFLGLGWHESDYFQRSLMWNKARTRINDGHKHLNLNWNPLKPIAIRTQVGLEPEHHRSEMWDYNHAYFKTKWPTLMTGNRNIAAETIDNKYLVKLKPTKPSLPVFMTYPAFEKGIENMEGKGYFSTHSTHISNHGKTRNLRPRRRTTR